MQALVEWPLNSTENFRIDRPPAFRGDRQRRLAQARLYVGPEQVRQQLAGLRTTTVAVPAAGSWTIYRWLRQRGTR